MVNRYACCTHTAFDLGELHIHLVKMFVDKHHQRLDSRETEGEDRRIKGTAVEVNGGNATVGACSYLSTWMGVATVRRHLAPTHT